MTNLGNLTLTTINGIGLNAASWTLDYATSQVVNALFGHKDSLRFYWDQERGGSILQVLVKGVVGGAVGTIASMAVNAFNGWIDGKKPVGKIESAVGEEWNRRITQSTEDDRGKYGKMVLEEGTVYALDEWGDRATEALMLAVKTDNQVTISQTFPAWSPEGDKSHKNSFTTQTLVWYDTTAIVSVNSDKNVITTRVQGRDYSRKELVSNGDIKFSVSGQISSGLPDVYPTAEVEKFFKVMQHKGIVQVNCQALNVLGVEQILITDFNLNAKEGSKSVQNYSFSGLGLQPSREIAIENDTIEIIAPPEVTMGEEGNPWVSMLEGKAKAAAKDIFSRSVALATGMLNESL